MVLGEHFCRIISDQKFVLDRGMGHSRSFKEKQAYTTRNSEQIPLLFVVPRPHKLRLPLDRMTANLNSIYVFDKQELTGSLWVPKPPFFVMPTVARISES
jgi:hypothetical protein